MPYNDSSKNIYALWDTELDKEDTTHWQAFRNDSQVLATIELARHPPLQADHGWMFQVQISKPQ